MHPGAHSHIRGLGLDDALDARMVSQAGPRRLALFGSGREAVAVKKLPRNIHPFF